MMRAACRGSPLTVSKQASPDGMSAARSTVLHDTLNLPFAVRRNRRAGSKAAGLELGHPSRAA